MVACHGWIKEVCTLTCFELFVNWICLLMRVSKILLIFGPSISCIMALNVLLNYNLLTKFVLNFLILRYFFWDKQRLRSKLKLCNVKKFKTNLVFFKTILWRLSPKSSSLPPSFEHNFYNFVHFIFWHKVLDISVTHLF